MKKTFFRLFLGAWASIFAFVILLPSAALAASSPAEWERVLQAAKQEGVVSVLGTTGVDVRDALTLPFQKAYGIQVDYFAGSGAQQSTRVGAERRAGKYVWDIFVGGTSTGLTSMIPIKAFDSLDPALILPEVKDPKNWRGGGIEFADPGRQMAVLTPSHRVILIVNSAAVDPNSFKSYKELLSPKWKGQIAADDPRRSGPGQATFTFFYLHPELGPEFIRALARQELVLFRDPSQMLNLIGQGRYPILVGPREAMLADALKRNLPISVVNPSLVREGSDISPASGNVAMFNRAPHPNAAKVYINWLLSKEGQIHLARAFGSVSNRLDVPHDHAEPWRVPRLGAIKTYTAEAMEAKDSLLQLLKEVLKN